VDVLHGRQVPRRGQAPLQWCQALGAQGAQARPNSLEERLQALQHVCEVMHHLQSCAFTNVSQSQEQVHTVAAQVRTSIERSCINSQDASTGAQTTPKALGDLLCNVNIVWFKVHNRSPVKLAVSISVLMKSVNLVSPMSESLQF
jgi:hypothetical protein